MILTQINEGVGCAVATNTTTEDLGGVHHIIACVKPLFCNDGNTGICAVLVCFSSVPVLEGVATQTMSVVGASVQIKKKNLSKVQEYIYCRKSQFLFSSHVLTSRVNN